MAELIVRRNGPVGRVIISNPKKLNAMSLEMWQALPSALAELDGDPKIRMIVLEGDGNEAFMSGADISQFQDNRINAQTQDYYDAAVAAAYAAPEACSKPVVAKISGICMGGGLGLAAACDLRFCRDDSRFRMPASRLGIGYGASGVQRFMLVFGLQNTLDIFFSARIFDAFEAQRMGFVTRIAPRESFDRMVEEWCSQVADNAPLVLTAVKKTANGLLPILRPDRLGDAQAAIAACLASDDYREGVRAFSERRKPLFRGT